MVGFINRHPVAGGFLLGFTWGVVIRVWMRFISTDPEFTWSGTGYIVGAATVVGTLLGVAALRRRKGGRGWWRLNGLAVLALGVAAGGVMIPSVLLAALAIGRRTWQRSLRLLLILIAVGVQVFLMSTVDLPRGRTIPALVWYTVLIGAEALATAIIFLPSLSVRSATSSPRQLQTSDDVSGTRSRIAEGSLD
jgi:hypothetical protein